MPSAGARIGVPERVAMYGLTAADPLDLAVLAAVGDTTDVDLYLLHPSPGLWSAAAPTIDPGPVPDRAGDPTAGLEEIVPRVRVAVERAEPVQPAEHEPEDHLARPVALVLAATEELGPREPVGELGRQRAQIKLSPRQ